MILRYMLRRLLLMIPVLFGVTVLVFSLTRIAPGNPVQVALGLDYTPEQGAQMRHELGLDQPFAIQYVKWLGGVLHGDFGRSIVMNNSVGAIIWQRLPTTATLAVAAVVIALLVSFPLGIIAAIKKDSWIDNLLRILAIFGVSMPVFWVGILLLMLFAVHFHWFPASGGLVEHGVKGLVLPALALSASFTALITRMVRSTMLEVLGEDFIRTARAKGLGSYDIYVRHALRNSLIPVITVVGFQFGSILSGAVLTETIFNIPGIGRLLLDAATRRDYPLIQGVVLVTAFTFICVNLLVDILYMLVNPQIRYS